VPYVARRACVRVWVWVRVRSVCLSLGVRLCAGQDPTTPTGLRVNYPEASVPKDRNGAAFTTTPFSRMDGFSTSTTAMTYFPNVSIELTPGLPGWQDVAVSLDASCPTLLIDAVTGEHLPHFAELDYTSGADAEKAFMIWPSRQLKFSRRYIVAVRGLRNTGNLVIPPSEGFRALRDGQPSSDPDIEGRRALFEDMFAILAATGVNRGDLQVRPLLSGARVHSRLAAHARAGRGACHRLRGTLPRARSSTPLAG
jgi:hypothetical protein